MLQTVAGWLGFDEQPHFLRVPRQEEFEGILLLGDPGTGKTQIIHQLIAQVRLRRPAEAGICYDPACEFIEAHFDPETDIVLNPLDERFIYWSPSLEVETDIDRQLVAESFFPYQENMMAAGKFFIDGARDIFELMLAEGPDAATIVVWLCDEKRIDELVAGTEIALKISKKAGPQRAAVLSTLAEVGKLLRMLPRREEGAPALSLSKWAERRRGWIFITSTQETRDALRPLQAAFMNILMKRLLSVPGEWGRDNPCWLIVDEAHALGRLPMLPTFMVESRKYGIKPVFGTQSKHQFRRHYGEDALTMLAAPHLKIFLRCNEAEAAQWVSDNIGEEEKERPRVGITSGGRAGSRDTVSYSTFIERRAAVSKEQIMSLQNRSGFWKYSDMVVPFRIEARAWPRVAKGFEPRRMKMETAPPPPTSIPPSAADAHPARPAVVTPLSTSQHHPNVAPATTPPRAALRRDAPSITPTMPDEGIDLNF